MWAEGGDIALRGTHWVTPSGLWSSGWQVRSEPVTRQMAEL